MKTDPHFDQYDNLLMVVEGAKDVLLLPPTAREELGFGPLLLQDHGHPVRYRNIWLLAR